LLVPKFKKELIPLGIPIFVSELTFIEVFSEYSTYKMKFDEHQKNTRRRQQKEEDLSNEENSFRKIIQMQKDI
jgi:hypothetical protein